MNRMQGYIPLDREFVEFDDRLQNGERDDFLFGFNSSSKTGKSWSDILKNRCTVILAEAGSGKTMEFRAQTEQLRREDKPAFFCRLEILAEEPFEDALELGRQEFQSWIDSDVHGYFFLDSVDEARLTSPRAFERAIIHFVKAVEPYKDRSTVVISTRPHAWLAQADRAMLKNWLAFPEETQTVSTDASASDFNHESHSPVLENGTTLTVETEKSSAVAIVQMEPLNPGQVRNFAAAQGVEDTDGFMQAINHADADVFATRPSDLPSLVDYWKNKKRIGSYSEGVSRDISLKLSEENPTHSHGSPISADRTMAGVKALAAAVTLTKRTSILLPDQPVDDALRGKCLNTQEVLPDWQPGEIQALLSHALFDEALYGSVRFHHRTVREYLAACWFKDLLQQQTGRRGIERLFFVSPYGVLPEVVVPSLKPIVGWLSIWDRGIRERTLHIDPKILLEHGDPSSLDIGTRETLLRKFAKRYEDRNNTPLSLHIREVRRLADEGLAGVIHELLETYRGHVDVRELLLRVIREGRIPACGPIASTFATDTNIDPYTRSVAVQAVGLIGSPDEQQRLVQKIIGQASTLEQRIISAAIEALWPNALTDQDVLLLLENTPDTNESELGVNLEHKVSQIPDRISDVDRTHTFLSGALKLVSQPPLYQDRICRISKRYAWLLKLLWTLVKRLNLLHHAPETVPEFLESIILCCQSHDYVPHYRDDMDNEIAQLLSDNAEVRHALFWHECAQARKLENEPVTDWRFIYISGVGNVVENVWDVTRDADSYLQALRERPDPEDKRVALSVLIDVCDASQNADLLKHIREAVSGDPALEDELDRRLTPPAPSKEWLAIQENRSKIDLQRQEQEKEKAQARQTWIERLKADPSMVGDLSLADKGQVWDVTWWLLLEIKKKAHRDNQLAASRWECLLPDFGEAVADKFRDFCQAFWRRYTRPVRPESAKGSQTIPPALLVGISGLAMEANGDETWAAQLTDNEVEIATRYALRELNGFPAWFPSLLQAKPEPVRKVLREEIEWECNAFPPDGVSLYVLEKLYYTRLQMGNDLQDDITDILTTKADVPVNPLKKALAIILGNATPPSQAFQDSVARHAETASAERQKTLWLSALLCLDAERALTIMDPWVNSGTKQDGERRVSLIINQLWGDEFDSSKSEHCSYRRPDFLLRLLEIVYSHVRIDGTQAARTQLLQLLCGIPGKPTYDALIRLSESQSPGNFKDYLLNQADSHAENDAAPQEWTAAQVAEFGRDAEKNPETQQDLFDIAVSRLDDIKFDLEEGDDSEASLWQKADDEIELRRSIANRLRLISRDRYTTGSEEELADRTRTDIRLHHPKVDARIPVEIKIAGKWSANELRERMENQLVGQYLREACYGIFLLVNRGADRDKKSWRHDGNLSFSTLVQWLKDESRTLLNERVQDIEVIGIDLTRRAR